jgi:hypothetical protein
MNSKTTLVRIALALAVLLIPTGGASAQGPGGDVLLFGQNYTLESGDTLNGSLAVIGGSAMIEEDAAVNGDVALIGGNLEITGVVNGDVALIGGNLTISGTIHGDIVIVGGQASLKESALVKGDIAAIGGNVEKEPGAEITGTVTNNAPPVIDLPQAPNVPDAPNPGNLPGRPEIRVNVNPFWEAASVIGRAAAVALIGMLLSLFLQPQLDRVSETIIRQPMIAGGYGLLTIIVAPVAIVILAITIILIPVALLAALVVPLAWIFGMIAFGQEVGDRFTKAIHQTWAPVLTVGFGTFVLVLAVGLIGMIPCVGWLASFLVTLVVIGAVAMTWFGSRSTPGSTLRAAPVEESPPAS